MHGKPGYKNTGFHQWHTHISPNVDGRKSCKLPGSHIRVLADICNNSCLAVLICVKQRGPKRSHRVTPVQRHNPAGVIAFNDIVSRCHFKVRHPVCLQMLPQHAACRCLDVVCILQRAQGIHQQLCKALRCRAGRVGTWRFGHVYDPVLRQRSKARVKIAATAALEEIPRLLVSRF